MHRRGVAHALVVTGLAVAVCGLIAWFTSSPPRHAFSGRDTTTVEKGRHGQPPDQHRVAPPGTSAGGGATATPSPSTGQEQDGGQEARPRPPTDIPTKPISFVRRSGATNGIALTIDDGPHPVWTPRMLDLLRRYHVRATFCLIGEQVREYPALVRRIVAEGHTLCDHTWDHDEQLPRRPEGTVDHEIDSTYDAIVAATGGVKPLYYRAPGGNWDSRMTEEARRLGMVSLNWSVDPTDWRRPGVKSIVSTILDDAGPGDVVLVHDGGGDRSQTIAALETILPTFLGRGYVFTTP